MSAQLLTFLFFLSLFSGSLSYTLKADYSGSTFFDNWQFWNYSDPTHGYVYYVSAEQAWSWGLVKVQNGQAFIYCDGGNIAGSGGRSSVRLQSWAQFNQGLFVIDLAHMPHGCGTWPAYWLCGANWPNNGEIDIIEGVNQMTNDYTTLHTSDGCTMQYEYSGSFTGYWNKGSAGNNATNCYVNAANQYSNQGCSINDGYGTFGSVLNQKGGGVFATQWTGNGIKMWFWTHDQVPYDLKSNNPNPSGWGTPVANFEFGSHCSSSHFGPQNIIINLTFCGDWAGSTFASDCPGLGSCEDYVKYNPQAFQDAYWQINYVKVFQ